MPECHGSDIFLIFNQSNCASFVHPLSDERIFKTMLYSWYYDMYT